MTASGNPPAGQPGGPEKDVDDVKNQVTRGDGQVNRAGGPNSTSYSLGEIALIACIKECVHLVRHIRRTRPEFSRECSSLLALWRELRGDLDAPWWQVRHGAVLCLASGFEGILDAVARTDPEFMSSYTAAQAELLVRRLEDKNGGASDD